MGKSKIRIIVAREFAIRVRKKSFIFTTILAPLLMAALFVVPALIAAYSGDVKSGQLIWVADRSGIVLPYLQRDSALQFLDAGGQTLEELKENFRETGAFAVLEVEPLDSSFNTSVTVYAEKPLDIDTRMQIQRRAGDAVRDYKISRYNLPGLQQAMDDLQAKVPVNTYKIDGASGKEQESRVEIYMAIGYVASFLIYIFIFMFGSMVMRSVIEEKTTRVIEVIISSVKPFELMMGKILGVASVALTQFLIWIVLTVAIISGFSFTMGAGAVQRQIQQSGQMQLAGAAGMGDMNTVVAGLAEEAAAEGTGAEAEAENAVSGILSTLGQIDFMSVIGAFLIYFVLGYLLYAGMFAAVGASVDNEADTQQLILPVTMPLIIGLFIMIHTFQYPDSSLSLWASIIPLTSPMVMMARIAYGVPGWQLALSIGLLAGTFVGCTYLSGKIYRTGILMYGKKASWKDLGKWIRYK